MKINYTKSIKLNKIFKAYYHFLIYKILYSSKFAINKYICKLFLIDKSLIGKI